MKKVLIGIFLCLVPVFVASLVIGGPTYTNRERLKSAPMQIDYKSGDTTWAVKITNSADSRVFEVRHDGSFANYLSGQTRFYVDGSGNLSLYDSSGTLDTYIPSSRVVVIDTIAELSTWSGAAAGSSYFQMEAGKTYIVDPHLLATSGCAPGGTTAMGTSFSGVTAHLPLAATGSDRQSVVVMWATTGSLAAGSGLTTVQVWPATLAGTTKFGTGSAIGVQNMTGMVTSGSSTVSVTSTAGSYNIDAYGETGTWMLFYNSAVSAQMVDRDLP